MNFGQDIIHLDQCLAKVGLSIATGSKVKAARKAPSAASSGSEHTA